MNTVLKDYDKINKFAESPFVVTVSMISRAFYGKIKNSNPRKPDSHTGLVMLV